MTAYNDSTAGEGTRSQYDVIVVGGSFAGLAVASQLRGHRVLVIDQRPIGTHQTSTCAVPLATAEAVGALSATQEIHEYASLHTGGREYRYRFNEPYVTFDYYAFCQAMLARTDAEVLLAKATKYEGGTVETTQGPVSAPFVVDASGWRSLTPQGPSRDIPLLGYGVETELPVRLPVTPALHFYFEKGIVRSGYAWVFPCGQTTRIGVCSFEKDVRLGPILDAFLSRFGLSCGPTHGGPMPIALRKPLAGDSSRVAGRVSSDRLFVVGDACGQCMPLWAEGIRSAIYFSLSCGRAISDALDGSISPIEAQERYAALVRRKASFHNFVLFLQRMVAIMPDRLRGVVLRAIAWPPLARRVIGLYLRGSGWVSGELRITNYELQSGS
jgi:flavin-dependent dehydrogenase